MTRFTVDAESEIDNVASCGVAISPTTKSRQASAARGSMSRTWKLKSLVSKRNSTAELRLLANMLGQRVVRDRLRDAQFTELVFRRDEFALKARLFGFELGLPGIETLHDSRHFRDRRLSDRNFMAELFQSAIDPDFAAQDCKLATQQLCLDVPLLTLGIRGRRTNCLALAQELKPRTEFASEGIEAALELALKLVGLASHVRPHPLALMRDHLPGHIAPQVGQILASLRVAPARCLGVRTQAR